MTLPGWLTQTDKAWFRYIQLHLTSPMLDPVMMVIRNPLTWIPLYVFMLYWIIRSDRKLALRFIMITLITICITDYTAAQWLKPFFGRWRPCYDPDTMGTLRGLISCGGLYSFPSNHATNHFCLATFWFGAVWTIKKQRWYWLFMWAAIVCSAQVYVGKHFPLDVLGGALYGTGTGASGLWLFRHWPALQQRFFRMYTGFSSSLRVAGLRNGRSRVDTWK